MASVVHEPIDLNRLIRLDEQGDPGGLVMFLGMVRNQTGGKGVVKLEYEAFESMALAELESVEGAARENYEIQGIEIVHRIGTLGMGEVAVAIVVKAAHRDAAFDACRFAIDTLKKSVPIWKKEFFEDGAVWVGEGP
ncbi:MAG: molybdenum cofactor biosynthesis protein MoaE [Planctomycetota bacterium]